MISGANRFFCGRVHRRPLLIYLLDWLGYHKEYYRVMGETQVRIRWVSVRQPWPRRPVRGRSIYTCRKPVNHWRATLKPQGLRWVNSIHDTRGADVPDNIRNRNTPYWKARALKVTRKQDMIQIPTDSWEIGHKYEYTRWQELLVDNGSN